MEVFMNEANEEIMPYLGGPKVMLDFCQWELGVALLCPTL